MGAGTIGPNGLDPEYDPNNPAHPDGGRKPGDWKSRYEPDACKMIRCEALYLAFHLAVAPLGILALWIGNESCHFGLPERISLPILKYGSAWLSGILGGTLFSAKWLYHSVARQIWNLDRRLWRYFTPHISGGLAFAVIALISSGVIQILDSDSTNSRSLVIGVGFLVGYFSDHSIAKLTEIAETLFGRARRVEPVASTKELPSAPEEPPTS